MMNKVSFCYLLLAFSCAETNGAIKEYCGKGMCKLSPHKHITCDTIAHFLSTCPKDARVVDLTYENVDQIIDLHNEYRNRIAGGNETGFDTAAKMPTMVSGNI